MRLLPFFSIARVDLHAPQRQSRLTKASSGVTFALSRRRRHSRQPRRPLAARAAITATATPADVPGGSPCAAASAAGAADETVEALACTLPCGAPASTTPEMLAPPKENGAADLRFAVTLAAKDARGSAMATAIAAAAGVDGVRSVKTAESAPFACSWRSWCSAVGAAATPIARLLPPAACARRWPSGAAQTTAPLASTTSTM